MKLSDFETVIRLMVPSANVQRVPQASLRILINKGVKYVNRVGKILVKSVYFNAAIKTNYIISDESNLSDFVCVGESGLWYNTGTEASPYYVQLDGVDRNFLNDRYPNWQNAAAGTPLKAVFEPNLIIVYPKPTAVLASGLFLPDYVYAPSDMSGGDDYPFTGTATEIPALEALDDGIIDYVRWILAHSVGEKQEGIITRQEADATINNRIHQVRSRPDFKANRDFKIGRVRRG